MKVTHVLKIDSQYPDQTYDMKVGQICTTKHPFGDEEIYILKLDTGYLSLNNPVVLWQDLKQSCYILPPGSRVTLVTSVI